MVTPPIERFSKQQYRVLDKHLHFPKEWLFGPRQRWDFTLFLLGERPACRLTSTQYLVSPRGVDECRRRPEEFARFDYMGQLLREFEVPYFLDFGSPMTEFPDALSPYYYVANDPERFSLLPDPYQRAGDHTPSTEARQLGRFLGYPSDAIEAFPKSTDRNKWLTHLESHQLDETARPLLDAITIPRELPKYEVLGIVLPYSPPATPEIAEKHLEIACQYLSAGLRADWKHGIRTLAFLLDETAKRRGR